MSMFIPERAWPARLGAAALATGLLVSALNAPHQAHAAAACRADPLVHLTNGTTVDVSATIYDVPADVTAISYVLHGPVGTAYSGVTWPAWDPFTAIETFQYVADQAPGQYRTDTLVSTGSLAAVTAYTRISGQGLFAANGTSGQAISVYAVGTQVGGFSAMSQIVHKK